MSTDARLSTGLPAHPKTKKLIRRVGESGAWHLVCLILWARANRPDGDLEGMSAEDIELAVDWRGEPDAFVAALVAVGFLDGEEGAYQLHDWAEHQPWAAGSEARAEKARWAALVRRHGRDEAARQMPEYAARLATSSGSAATGTNSTATSRQEAGEKPAPSPSPSPSPSPNPSPKAEASPHTPAGAGAPRKGRASKPKVAFPTFIAACHADGVKPIPADDPIFRFAADTRIPREFLHLAWLAFSRKHRDSGRLQKDWRAHFRDAVRGNWGKVWYFPAEGGDAALTTVGIALQRERDAEAARREDQAA